MLATEKFATINYALGYADYPQQEFDFLWKKLVESMDHNHNGQGGSIGDNRKIEYMRLAAIQGGEIQYDSWKNARLIHDWIHAGAAEGGLTISSDHQQFRLAESLICAEMVRGTRFVSVKVVRGDEVGSLQYPPAGTYVFRYSLSSGPGDWKAAKAYRAGIGSNNPLLPISVADDLTGKSLPPTRSFCSVKEGNLVLSALKKADGGPAILLRMYEMEGSPAQTPVEFLGHTPAFEVVNLLEEESNPKPQQTLHIGSYGIETIRFRLDHDQQ